MDNETRARPKFTPGTQITFSTDDYFTECGDDIVISGILFDHQVFEILAVIPGEPAYILKNQAGQVTQALIKGIDAVAKRFPNQEFLLARDKEALGMYLEHWQCFEAPNHPKDKRYVREEALARLYRMIEIEQIFLEWGYISPEDIVYSNEAEPMGVNWKSKDFNWEDHWDNIVEDNFEQ